MTEADSAPISSPGPVGDGEDLGRRVFSLSIARQAARNRVPRRVFEERPGTKELSVDRLTVAGDIGIAVIVADALAAAASRPQPPNTFSGWAVVDAGKVRYAGCGVIDSPTSTSPYHADIVLPDAAMESADAQRQYATTLAGMSRWRPWP